MNRKQMLVTKTSGVVGRSRHIKNQVDWCGSPRYIGNSTVRSNQKENS